MGLSLGPAVLFIHWRSATSILTVFAAVEHKLALALDTQSQSGYAEAGSSCSKVGILFPRQGNLSMVHWGIQVLPTMTILTAARNIEA